MIPRASPTKLENLDKWLFYAAFKEFHLGCLDFHIRSICTFKSLSSKEG